MVAISTITDFINRHLVAAEKIALREFIIQFQAQFNPEQDISFMDYFLELSKRENKGKFIVHHEKLFEYGITTSNKPSHVKERLDKLSMSENKDFELTKLRQLRKQGGTSEKNVYMLTPKCFKTILIGASKHSSHTVDVLKYKDYYLFLEEAVNYYMDYQHLVDEAEKRMKDGTIGDLRNDNQSLQQQLDQVLAESRTTNANLAIANSTMRRVEERADTIIKQNIGLHTKIDNMQVQMNAMFSILSHTVFTPNVVKQMITLYAKDNANGEIVFPASNPWDGTNELKWFFLFIYTNYEATELTVQIACRNTSGIHVRIAQLMKDEVMKKGNLFHSAFAVGLCDKDTNEERKIFENVFGESVIASSTKKSKEPNYKKFVFNVVDMT